MKLTYTKVGDYLLPNLTIKNQKYKRINKYGLLKLHYLKKNSKALYTTLLMKNELTDYLVSVSNECENRLNNLMEQFKKSDKLLSEKSKEINQLEWVKLMNNYKIIAEEIILNELIYNKNVWVQTIIFVLASTEFVLPYKFYYGKFPYPYFERIKLIMRKRNIKINVFLNEDEKRMLVEKSNKARLSQSDFIRKLINDYANDDGTKSNLEEERVQLLKIIENLSLLKRQMDFLGYRDYSNLIIKQINQIKNILNDY